MIRVTRNKIFVSFSKTELSALFTLAGHRAQTQRKHNINSERSVGSLRTSIYIGLKGEYAVARALGLVPDVSIYRSGDGGVDFVYRGRSIDVKNCGSRLIIPSLSKVKSDAIICVTPWGTTPDPFLHSYGGPHRYRDVVIVGWTNLLHLTNHSLPTSGFEGTGREIGLEALMPISEVLKWE